MKRHILKFTIGGGLIVAAAFPIFQAGASDAPFSDSFSGLDGLITNEYAHWNGGRGAVSPNWDMDSGSLFEKDGAAWSGKPDDKEPNATSSNGTNSAIFRLVTQRNDFGDVAVTFKLNNHGLSSTGSTPAVAWDGIHIFLRYQDETHLYYASINRRDGKTVIKKKVTGGPDNGGTYYDLTSYVSHPVPYNQWQNVRATVKNNSDGSVTITLGANGVTYLTATDRGVGGPPITQDGRVGIRGDNADFAFDDFSVTPLGGAQTPTQTATATATATKTATSSPTAKATPSATAAAPTKTATANPRATATATPRPPSNTNTHGRHFRWWQTAWWNAWMR